MSSDISRGMKVRLLVNIVLHISSCRACISFSHLVIVDSIVLKVRKDVMSTYVGRRMKIGNLINEILIVITDTGYCMRIGLMRLYLLNARGLTIDRGEKVESKKYYKKCEYNCFSLHSAGSSFMFDCSSSV